MSQGHKDPTHLNRWFNICVVGCHIKMGNLHLRLDMLMFSRGKEQDFGYNASTSLKPTKSIGCFFQSKRTSLIEVTQSLIQNYQREGKLRCRFLSVITSRERRPLNALSCPNLTISLSPRNLKRIQIVVLCAAIAS